MWGVKSAVWSVKCAGSSGKWEVRSVECEVWSVECEVSVWSAKSAVWSVKCEVWSVKEAVRSEKCEVWTVKCEVWSVECEVWSLECEVWSVECEDFASSLAEKNRLSREGHGRDTVFLPTYRSFILGKLPPPACPGLCYMISLWCITMTVILQVCNIIMTVSVCIIMYHCLYVPGGISMHQLRRWRYQEQKDGDRPP